MFSSNSSGAWARYFDFGTGTALNWFATPNSGTDFKFRITTAGSGSEQGPYGAHTLNTAALRIHTFEVASSTMSAYVNGATYAAATVSITPSQISGSLNYIGKSQYGADAYFNGYVSEFMVVASGLSAADRSTVEQNQSLYYSVALANATGTVSCCALDSLGGTAAAAYSLRQLSSSYAGSAITVTRSSDSTTANIGFVNKALDTATLMSFCASTTCTVSTWYDQSGNGVNLTLLSGYSLPKIVVTGTLQTTTPGNLPAINFASAELQNAALTNSGLNQTGSVSAVVQAPSSPNNGYAGVVGWSGDYGPFFGNLPGPAWGYYMSGHGIQDTYQTLSANQQLITTWAWTDYTEAMTISVNGAARGFTTSSGASGSYSPMRIGGDGGSAYFGGYLLEIVVFSAYEMTSSDRSSLERSQSQFYSIALSGILSTDNASADLGPVNVASNASSSVTFNFTTAANLGSAPVRVVTKGATGLDFTDAGTGTCDTNGSSYNYMAGSNCTVNITFAPLYPGLRTGAVQLLGPSGTVGATAYLSGIGTAPQPDFPSGNISTFAGSATAGYTGNGSAATNAQLNMPKSIALDGSGNLYIADSSNNVIRMVNASTGVITTYAGNHTAGYSGDGAAATTATLNTPTGVAVDGAGNVYIADSLNNVIRKVDAVTGNISTWAGTGTQGYNGDNGPATSATMNSPQAIAFDFEGNGYISDANNNVIRKASSATGTIATIAGTGTAGYSGDSGAAVSAKLNLPQGLVLDSSGNLYIADSQNQRIRKVDALTGIISTIAGISSAGYTGDGGPAASASLSSPEDVELDPAGNLYIADSGNNVVRKISALTAVVSTAFGTGTASFSGDGGSASSATFHSPVFVVRSPGGNLYIDDSLNNRIRKIDLLDAPSLTLPVTAYAATSAASYQTVENSGTSSLTIASLVSSSPNFTLGGASPTCATTNQVVTAGGSCLIGVEFTPSSLGAMNGTITLNDNALNAGGSAQSFAVNGTAIQAVPTITFTVPNQTYGVSPFTVSATSNSAGAITYSVVSGPATISGSTVTITGVGTVVLQASQAANGNYTAGTQNASFTVLAAAPTITFTVSNQTYGVSPFTVSATSNSAGAITYSVVSGPATISGSTVTITGVGTVVLQAAQAANGNYTAGTQNASFTVSAAAPTITFTVSNQTFGVSPFTVSATSNSAGAITYSVVSGPATISGSTVTITGVGTVALQAAQAANGNYTAGTQNASFTVSAAAPAITFTVSNQTYGVSPFTVSATSNSAGVITYTVVSGPATISGSTVTITGAGTVVLQASEAANGNYTAGTQNASFTVSPAAPTITFTVSNQTYGVSPFAVSATSNSAGAITYSMVSGPATISGATVTVTGVGTVVLQASQAANGNYTAGTQNASFTVSQATPTVALSSSSNPSTYNGGVTFTATVPPSATGIVTFLDGATSIGTGSVSSGAATFTIASLSGGSHSITAQYGGNSNYHAATSSAVTEVIDRTPVTVSIISTKNPSIYWDMVTFTFTFTGSGSAIPTGTATITADGSALTTVTLDGTGKATYSTSATTAGSHNIKAAYNGDDNYQ